MTVTILAFVYVPLNLATSIFGMNIEQLNESGKSLWIFILTAFIALIVTGGIWLLIKWWNEFRSWYIQRPDLYQGVETSSYSIGERVAMIVWLWRNGHQTWMRGKGAWWAILWNDRKPIVDSMQIGEPRMSASEYVSRYSQPMDTRKDIRRRYDRKPFNVADI